MQQLSAYHAGVDDFGEKLKDVRETLNLQQMAIGRRVRKTEKAAKSFSNYLSRIERGDEQNPSLDTLEDIAKGLGFPSLSAFFLQIERQTNSDLRPPTNPAHTSAGASAPLDPGGVHGGAVVPLSPADRELDQLVVDIGSRLLDAVSRRDSARAQTAPTRQPRTKQPQAPRKNRG